MKNNVIIRKQKFNIKTNSAQLALQVREKVNDALQYNLLDVYDQVFNSIEFEGADNFFINKISLNLGSCTKSRLTENLPLLVKNALVQYLHHPGSPKEIIQPEQKKEQEIITFDIDERAALLHYLHHGIYPRWFTAPHFMEPGAIVNSIKTEEIPALLQEVMLLQKNTSSISGASMRKRFIQLLSANTIEEVLKALIDMQPLSACRNTLHILQGDVFTNWFGSIFSLSSEAVKKEWIDLLLKFFRVEDGQDIAATFAENFISKPGVSINPVEDLPFSNIPPEIQSALLKAIDAIANEKDKDDFTGHSIKNNLSKQTKTLGAEGIYISNAGLIILHPFLIPLFQAIGLLNNKHHFFISHEAACKATVVLHYLQYANTSYEEHQMAFNKMLCGIDLETALPAGIELSSRDIDKCDKLLETVIKYWEGLKDAGVATLQEIFIRRKGELTFKQNELFLQVEQHAADVLIGGLPWGISTIKLPWLQHIIHTDMKN